MEEQKRKRINSWRVRAVKEGRLYYLDKGLFFNKANHRYDEAYKTMAEYLYPDHQILKSL